jgi:hypothetical protein
MEKRDLDDVLPLPEAAFHILVALAEGDRHGYAILQEVVERTDGKFRLGPGTELDDERRRYYRLTAFGKSAARAEAGRLAGLVRLARASGLEPKQT